MPQPKVYEKKLMPGRSAKTTKYPLAVIGTVAVDQVETPFGTRDRVFGGSASYFSYAASFLTPVSLVAVVGKDFPEEYRKILKEHSIDLSHLEELPGKTFSWKGRYGTDLNSAETLETQLNVLSDFNPKLHFNNHPEFVFLANIDPTIQLKVLDQLEQPRLKYVACDTMNYWISGKKSELLKVLGRVDCVVLNDGEARQLTGESNLIKAAQKIRNWGPDHIIIKKGEHGVLFFYEHHFSVLPAYPLEEVYDPTGAGDTFAGGFMGYLASQKRVSLDGMKNALAWATITASFTVEDFGLDRLRQITCKDLEARLRLFKKMLTF